MKKIPYTRTQVLLEPDQLKTMSEIASKQGMSLSSLLRKWVDQGLREHQQNLLARAADTMAEAYYSDGDLTGYSALDDDRFQMRG